MKKYLRDLVIIVIAVFVAVQFVGGEKTSASESVFDRIMRTKTLRCAYNPYPPAVIKDANNGEISGLFPDFITQMAKDLGLDIEWVEEVGWGNAIEGFKTGRYDAVCTPFWANADRAKAAYFVRPLYLTGVGAWVRSDDNRFNKSYDVINNENITIATIDGEMAEVIARTKFPKAKVVSLPQSSSIAELLALVDSGKADVTFVSNYFGEQFVASNPNSIKNAVSDKPVKLIPETFMIPLGENKLKSMLDIVALELLNDGLMDRLWKKYEVPEGSYYKNRRVFE